jgi:lipoprotein-anchoring transpeptidase ErfK/SrfK
MRRAVLASLAALAVLAPVAAAQTPPPAPPAEPRIAPGTKAAGIDVGGLTVSEARATLEQVAGPRLTKNVSVEVAGHRFRLTMERLRLRYDAERSAKRAYYAGRDNPQPVDVPLAISYRRSSVDRFSRSIDRRVHLAPRNATVRITLRKIHRRRSATGRDLDARALQAAIEGVLVNPFAKRLLRPGRAITKPRITADKLPQAYPTILTIDRSGFRLRLFKALKLSKTYRIAVGAAGFDTPPGLHRIRNKAVNPAWSAPNKPWAGLYAGRTVPGGAPDNPLKARWLGIANGVGIHGTAAAYSIGTRASHGCIRMTVPDVVDLYPRVPVGTPVLIR